MPAICILLCNAVAGPCQRDGKGLPIDKREESFPYLATKGCSRATRVPTILRGQRTPRRCIETDVVSIEMHTVVTTRRVPGRANRSARNGISLLIDGDLVIHRSNDKTVSFNG